MLRLGAILGLVALFCALGCRLPDVTMSRSAPSAYGYSTTDCRLLGPVEGAGGTQAEPWKRTEHIVEDAMRNMRDRAARMGANFVQIDRTEGSHVLSTEGWLIPLVKAYGVAYRCAGTPTMSARGDASTPNDGAPPPDGSPATDAAPSPDGSPRSDGARKPDGSAITL